MSDPKQDKTTSVHAHQESSSPDTPDVSEDRTKPSEPGQSVQDSAQDATADKIPEKIDRYRPERVLGKGGFGQVFLAYDEQLTRRVAIKVPNVKLLGPNDASLYLEEARTVAQLDHSHIVPVYDSGSTEQFPCYIVSKYIEGSDLAGRMKQSPLGFPEVARLIAQCGGALHYAHTQGLVHRDIKPGNILTDAEARPFIVDFGLALRDRDVGKGPQFAGTPAYMSPEQARGEGHRVDGRSDIYSLGVIMYELLTGQRPFRGDTQELLSQIVNYEPKPPRQINDQIPRELERICLKAMAKRSTDRYTTAADLAEDLNHFLERPAKTTTVRTATSAMESDPAASSEQPAKIVPKGLRSFDEHDADFFLELLPGPRDRDGLPESIRFWKTRIEQTDPDKTFSIGLLYGPSGCGKSSLMKAGLLPRLSKDVIVAYVEATPDGTENRVLRGLKKQIPGLPNDLELIDAFLFLRHYEGKRVVVVLDQFEQWLHEHRDDLDTELVHALRQCDGKCVQSVVLVRDDFWLAVSRFFRQLEIPLLEGQNSVLVDLFDPLHARKVLAEFGRSFGRLPALGQLNAEQESFLNDAVSGLSQEGKVICVRLALFGDMVKGKPWTPGTLREIGGTEGVGITFLEETFSTTTAPPEHRLHQRAARAVLMALLPDSGSEIKGHMRSHKELLDTSGYGSRPSDFADLVRILDSELRLITPTDPEGMDADDSLAPETTTAGTKYHQLTHDYLVPSLREWLTRKQRETWRGRAELRLEERIAQWSRAKENRYLPNPLEYLTIQTGVPRKRRTPPQRSMMRVATRRYGAIAAMILSAVSLLSWGAWEINGRTHARRLTQAIYAATPEELAKLIQNELPALRGWADAGLQQVANDENAVPDRRLAASLAVLASDESQVTYLRRRLLDCSVEEFDVVRNFLKPHKDDLQKELWKTLRDQQRDTNSRFYAGVALADYTPDAAEWTEKDQGFLVDQLVNANPVYWLHLQDYLRPLKAALVPPLITRFRSPAATDSIQKASATALASYVEDAALLAELTSDATPAQYGILVPVLTKRAERDEHVKELLDKSTKEQPRDDFNESQRVALGKRRAGAAISLVRMGQPEAGLEVLKVRDDPESLTQFVHGCTARGVAVSQLLDLLNLSNSVVQRYGILLALGGYDRNELIEDVRNAWVEQIKELYRTDLSSAIHGASGWLLRQWGYEKEAQAIEQRAVPYDPGREWFTLEIKLPPLDLPAYFTFVVFSDGKYSIGSPDSELDHDSSDEKWRKVEITRSFAVLDREITRGEYQALTNFGGFTNAKPWQKDPRSAMASADWYGAVSLCRNLTQLAGLSEKDQAYADPESLDRKEHPLDPLARVRNAPKNWPLQLDRRGFRLPTAAEWEIACRGGMVTTYGFGSDRAMVQYYGWYQDNSGGRGHYPRELRPNSRGLFDMHGNLYEWCHDWSGGNTAESLTDPMGPREGSFRVLRGGGWHGNASNCRSASRNNGRPSSTNNNVGFRVVFSLFSFPSRPQ